MKIFELIVMSFNWKYPKILQEFKWGDGLEGYDTQAKIG